MRLVCKGETHDIEPSRNTSFIIILPLKYLFGVHQKRREKCMFERISKFLDKVEGVFITSILAAATILTFTQVVFRYGLNNSIFWAEEVVLYLIISMSFLSTSMGIRKGAHISVDILKSIIPKSCLPIYMVVSAFIGMLFGLALLYYGGNLFLATLSRGQLSPALRIPVAWMYAFIPATAALQIFRYSEIIYSVWKNRLQPVSIEENLAQDTDYQATTIIQ